jgi:hypothetical protein
VEKSLTLRYNLSTLVIPGLCVALPLMRLGGNHWVPVALMFVGGLVFGYLDGRAVLARRDRLLAAKDREDVSDILGQSWLDPRFIAYLCVAAIGVVSIALNYDDQVLKIATASIWALVAGRCSGTFPSLVTLKKYARIQNAQPAA